MHLSFFLKSPKLLISHSLLATSHWLSSTRSSLLFSKKANLDKENLSSYRPISNLSFLSKLTERIVLARLNAYLPSNPLLNPHQIGFPKPHPTETLLVPL